MPVLEWKNELVHVNSEASDALAVACTRLTRGGWTPRFVVPVFPGIIHIVATRNVKSWHPPAPRASASTLATPKLPPPPKAPKLSAPPRRKPL